MRQVWCLYSLTSSCWGAVKAATIMLVILYTYEDYNTGMKSTADLDSFGVNRTYDIYEALIYSVRSPHCFTILSPSMIIGNTAPRERQNLHKHVPSSYICNIGDAIPTSWSPSFNLIGRRDTSALKQGSTVAFSRSWNRQPSGRAGERVSVVHART